VQDLDFDPPDPAGWGHRRGGPVIELPKVDEHEVEVEAGAPETWAALLAHLDRTFSAPGAGGYARLVGCRPASAGGPRPLAVGSTVPGFEVARAEPGSLLALEGRHRFSTYALTFRLSEAGPGRTLLRAESRATFPGLLGRAYRLAVISSGGHVLIVRRMLAAIARRAEDVPAAT
jgi:hypothetical protein